MTMKTMEDVDTVPVVVKHKVSGSDTFGEECDNCEELLATTQLNEKRMKTEESSNSMYELAYELLDARPSFAGWMEWILQYVPQRKVWQHRLVEDTIFCFKTDFRTSWIERFWDQWVTEDVLVPTPAAFATVIGVSDVQRFSLKEALLQHTQSNGDAHWVDDPHGRPYVESNDYQNRKRDAHTPGRGRGATSG